MEVVEAGKGAAAERVGQSAGVNGYGVDRTG